MAYESNIPPGTIEFSPWVNDIAKINPDVYTHAEGGEVLIPLGPALRRWATRRPDAAVRRDRKGC